MRPVLDPAGHRVPRMKPTCLLHTWRPHQRRPFALALHLHQHQSSRNLHLQYLPKNQSTQRCQSLITQGSDHPLVLEPHMVLKSTSVGLPVALQPTSTRVPHFKPPNIKNPQYVSHGLHRPTNDLWASFIAHSRSQRHQQPPKLPQHPHSGFTPRLPGPAAYVPSRSSRPTMAPLYQRLRA
jgi:hypothetical protein